MEVHIREATTNDALVVARIYIDSWNAGFGDRIGMRAVTDELVTRWRRDLGEGPQVWWVAERWGNVVGIVGIGPSRDPIEPDLGELDTIAVAPAHWRAGIGRALMAHAVSELSGRFPRAILWTLAGYEHAHLFYEATGWVRDSGVRAGGQEVSFRRALR